MSFEWHRRALDSIAQGSLTNSKRAECLVKGVYPTHIVKGNGAILEATDGKRYVDFVCALGSCLFGYANPHIINSVQAQLYKGWLYSLGSTLEVECAELVKREVQFCSKVRFLKTGTEGCAAAVRIARSHTGRDRVLSAGYHGWTDDFVSLSAPAHGIPKRSHIESLTSLDQIKDDVACVIIEPITTDYSPRRVQWLNLLVEKCKKNGTLVVFDEIITGFRWPKLCFSLDKGFQPDILLLGKACAGGLPLSIVCLKEGIGDNQEWFVSGTFAGDLLALSALHKTFELLRNVYKIDDLWREGGYFLEEFNELCPDRVKIDGYPTRGVFVGDDLFKALLWQEAAKAGILLGPSFFFGFQHIDHRRVVMSSLRDIVQQIKLNKVRLEGEMPTSPFAQKVRSS